jgi:hypothetical protein
MKGRILNGVKYVRLKEKSILGLEKEKTMMGIRLVSCLIPS